ncbi:processed acidic surface protein [Oceanobacillus sp. 1P07AA]|uniref:processed acidic surface protein n=1 Tax=Oceanobacillus sp. 1P07AA TaxID=3132293 RepID=UPI0039A43076
MKKSAFIFCIIILFFAVLPSTISAQTSISEKELERFASEVSQQRGFTVTIEDLEYILISTTGLAFTDVESIDELELYLGEVIEKNGSNLEWIYDSYDLDIDSLEKLLHEYGETINDYVFVEELYLAVDFYIEEKIERDPYFDDNLEVYLKEVSAIRGFTVTREHIVHSLSLYETTLEEFKTIERLSDFLAEVIKKDLSNLGTYFDMSKDEVLQLMKDNDLDINDYVYLDDLGIDLYDFIEWDEEYSIDFDYLMKTYDLTEEELQQLDVHIWNILENASDETIERIINLGERMMAFEEFDTATELTASQIAELVSIYHEFVSVFAFDIQFSLIKDGVEEPLSLNALMSMTELVNADLKISIYNLQGDFLADIIITGEMVSSETIIGTGNAIKPKPTELKQTLEPVQKEVASEAATSTVKGAKLPKTAANYVSNSLFGIAILLIGTLIFIRSRKVTSEK